MQEPNANDANPSPSSPTSGQGGPEMPLPRPRREHNVGQAERYGSAAAGAALLLLALARRRLSGLLLGAAGTALLGRAISGQCSLYRALGISSAFPERPGVPDNVGTKVEASITIHRSPEEIFRFWRDFGNLPRFMKQVKSVTALDGKRSHWVAEAPGGRVVEWEAEIINEHPNAMIAWESLPGAELENAGSVRFQPAPGGRGTEVRVTMQYRHNPESGLLRSIGARLLGKSVEEKVGEDLARLKVLLETGEIATAASRPAPSSPMPGTPEESSGR